jgi:hypothetical protein
MAKREERMPTLDELQDECKFVLGDYWVALIKAHRAEPSEALVERLQKASVAYSQFESNMNPDDVD